MPDPAKIAARTRADYEARAKDLIQEQLANHSDEGVRAIAMGFDPPPESVSRVADKLQEADRRAMEKQTGA